jgi:ParB-like chromosome segregation protein Spo0J
MVQFICKCGRTCGKSTTADTTGYRLDGYGPEHKCYGCPYAMAVKDSHWNDGLKRWDYVIRAWECRTSQKLRYSTYASLSLGSKNSGSIYSLDFHFMQKVQKAIEKIDAIHVESNPPGERGPQYGADGLYRLPIYADQNKKGIAAKQTLFDMFFKSDGSRRDVTPEEEKFIILKQIEEAKSMGKLNPANISAGLEKVKSITETLSNVAHFEMVPIESIETADYNPFAESDTDESRYNLAMSIQASGLIEPLAVNKKAPEKYKLISGEHRFSAIRQYLSFKNIPCMVFEGVSDDEAQLKLYEANSYREYTAEQKLKRYQELEQLLTRMKEDGKYQGAIQKGIAVRLGVSTHQVRKYKKITKSLSEEQQQKVINGEISIDRAYQLTQPVPSVAAEQPIPLIDNEKSGRASAFGQDDKPLVVDTEPEFRNSATSQKNPNVTTPFNMSHIGNFNEAVSLLNSLPYYPGQECAIITNSNTTQQGIIDHFEVYKSSLRVSILIQNIRHSYHVASIGTDLFIGAGCLKQAREAASTRKQ